MSESRNRTAKRRRTPASPGNVSDALDHGHISSRDAACEDSCNGVKLPPQEPPFLEGIPKVGEVYDPREPATQELQQIIEQYYYTTFFEDAIARVASQHIPELEQIKTLYQFYFYVDTLVRWIPEIRVWCWDGEVLHERTVYNRIVQFYYYFNQRELEALQSPIDPEEGTDLSPISLWLRDFANEWGAFCDTERSAAYLESFMYAPEYNWQDYQKPPTEYATFNEFFARQFRDIEVQRPVAQKDNDRVIVFPAESTFVGQWTVNTPVGAPLPGKSSIVVKHIEWPIEELLQDSEYADTFAGGIFCHSFLNTYDYHRLHTSVAGKVLEAKFIPGQVYLEVELAEQGDTTANGDLANAVIPKRYLDADDATGYQFVQCRGMLVLESAIGKVAILPMGMAQVSSVVFVTAAEDGEKKPIQLTPEEAEGLNYDEIVAKTNEKISEALVGKHLDKGEMFSYFQFGGSDCVMVFEQKANVNITAVANVHYPVRSQYGTSNIND